MKNIAILALAIGATCAACGGVKLNVVGGDFPEKAEWAETKLVPELEGWFGNIVHLLDGEGAEWNHTVAFELSRKPNMAHAISGSDIFRLNMDWAEKDPDEVVGACVHELAHLVQDYRPAPGRAEPYVRCPLWLSEGIADWVRWCNFEGEKGIEIITEMAKARPKHDASYRITASFLDWVVRNHGGPSFIVKLNRICREGRYSERTWEELTGQTRLRLAAKWRRNLMGLEADACTNADSDSAADAGSEGKGRVMLDGRPVDRPSISHAEVMAGGELSFGASDEK